MNNKIKKWSALLLLMIFCLTSAGWTSAAGSSSTTAAGAAGKMVLHGFYPSKLTYSADLEKFIDGMDSISFAWSMLDADDLTSLNTVLGKNGNGGFYYPDDFAAPLSYAKGRGKTLQLSVFSDWANAKRVLPVDSSRGAAIQAVINGLTCDLGNGQSLTYDGVVIDFEGLQDRSPQGQSILFDNKPISSYFNTFLKELKTALKPLGKKLYVAVNTRINFNGYDYTGILQQADKVIVMAHDFEPVGRLMKSEASQYMDYSVLNPIDSLAPLDKVKLALEDIKKSAMTPGDLSKVWLQISFSGAQWQYKAADEAAWEALNDQTLSTDIKATPTYGMIKDRIDNKDGKGTGITYTYNRVLQSPCIHYFNQSDKLFNILIYEDRTSVEAKMNLAKMYGLGGVSLWSIGSIPSNNDTTGKAFHLDIWDGIQANLKAGAVKPSAKVKIRFTNKKMEALIRTRLGKTSGDIYKCDLDGIYRLRIPKDTGVLSDLKNFSNLEYLDIQQAGVRDISPLSTLTGLKTLYLQRNQISDIRPLKNLTQLEVLSLNGNKVTDLTPLAGLTRLRELYLSENSITRCAPLKGMAQLRVLYLNKNQIADISGFDKFQRLYSLNLANNSISSIGAISGLARLRSLYLAGNPVRDFSPAGSFYSNLTAKDFSLE